MKTKMQLAKEMLVNPDKRFRFLVSKGLYNRVSDKLFLKIIYKHKMGKPLNLDSPQTFNEKLQWLKLYDRRPEYTKMVDKYAVRKHIAETIGEEYLIPLLGVWDNSDAIDFNALPNQFVLKCNHNSGVGLCICKDKSKLDIERTKEGLRRGLKQDYYLTGREWPYKNVPRKIIAERYLVDQNTNEIIDYKFHCFNGDPFYCQVFFDRHTSEKTVFYNMNWEKQEIGRPNIEPYKGEYPQPQNFSLMMELARKLAKNLPYARIDLYDVMGHVYFGEITFFPASGFNPFVPDRWDLIWGDLIKLPKKTV